MATTVSRTSSLNPLLALNTRSLSWVGWSRLAAAFETLSLFVLVHPEEWEKCRKNMVALRQRADSIAMEDWAWVVEAIRLYVAGKGLGRIVFVEQWAKGLSAANVHVALEEILAHIQEFIR